MFKHYLKIAMRYLIKHKGYSFINILGLAIGMACTIFILLYVQNELSYDRFHNDARDIYRIVWMSDNPQTRTPHPLAQAMARDFPEVKSAVSLSPTWGPGLSRAKLTVRYQEKRFEEVGFYEADSTFFKVFSFRLLRGEAETALAWPGAVVITEEMAHKYFADDDPIGKTIVIEASRDYPLTIAGVIENIPANSHFHFDFLISYMTFKEIGRGIYYEWADFGHFNYVKLAAGSDPQALEKKMVNWVQRYLDWPEENFERMRRGEIRFALQPITDIHLHSNLRWELEPNGDIAYVYLFSAAALLILLIACINFMNLTTARSANRAKEIGVRKVVGSNRRALIIQFLGESLFLATLSMLIALTLVELLTPSFNAITGQALPGLIGISQNDSLFGAILTITLLVGILSGSYPAFMLSAFSPASQLKSKSAGSRKSFALRKVLVVAQFAISIALIVGTIVVSAQLHFLKNARLGMNENQVVVLQMKNTAMRADYQSVKAALLQLSNVLSATAVSNVPGRSFNQNPILWNPDENEVSVLEFRVDYDFFKTLGVEIVAGRSFSEAFGADLEQSFILNETAARQFSWDTPVGKEITWFDDDVTRSGPIIGVASDFHFQSLHKTIEPLIFQVMPSEFQYLLVRIATDDVQTTVAALEQQWRKFDPSHAFEFSFLNDEFNQLYRSEERMEKVFGHFTLIALFVACLGLFALAAFAAEQRTKEIGIRKVLGASTTGLIGLLSKDFIKLVLLANLIAWPIAWLVMSRWLQNFAYRVDIGWWVFALAGGSALMIALVTVSTQAIKTALANPVEALRYE